MIDNLAVNLLVAAVWPLAAWRYLEAVRNPRRRVWREDRRAMRAHARMRKALR